MVDAKVVLKDCSHHVVMVVLDGCNEAKGTIIDVGSGVVRRVDQR